MCLITPRNLPSLSHLSVSTELAHSKGLIYFEEKKKELDVTESRVNLMHISNR